MPEPGTFPAPLTVTAQQLGDHVRVIAAGEIDVRTAADLRGALDAVLDGRPPKIMLDMSAVTFMDSTGLGVLTGARNRAGANSRVVVINPHPITRRILEITGLLELFTDDQARDQRDAG
jgi:anti-sigma B factor antagonist